MSRKLFVDISIFFLILLLVVPELQAQVANAVIAKSGSPVFSVAWSPDGKTFASSSENQVVTWYADTNTIASVYAGHSSPVVSGKFSHDGKWFLSVSKDNSILLRNLEDSKLNVKLQGSSNLAVYDLDMLDNGYNMIIPLDGKNLSRCFRLAATNRIVTSDFASVDSPVLSVTAFPDGKRVMVGTADGFVQIYTASTGEKIAEYPRSLANFVKPAFSFDGEYFVSASDRTHLVVSPVLTTSSQIITDDEEFVNSVQFSPDGKKVAAALRSGKIKVYNIEDGSVDREFVLVDPEDIAMTLVYSPDGEYILAGTQEGYLYRWSLTGKIFSDEEHRYIDPEADSEEKKDVVEEPPKEEKNEDEKKEEPAPEEKPLETEKKPDEISEAKIDINQNATVNAQNPSGANVQIKDGVSTQPTPGTKIIVIGNKGKGSGNGTGTEKTDEEDKTVEKDSTVTTKKTTVVKRKVFNRITPDDTLDITFGYNSLPSNFTGSFNLGAAYRRYDFNPLYLVFDGFLGVGITERDFPYEYKLGSRTLNNPVLYTFGASGGAGLCLYKDKIQSIFFTEVRMGPNMRSLCNNDLSGFILEKPVYGFYMDFVGGVQWQHARFDLGAQWDSNFGFMFKFEIAVSQKIRLRSTQK